MNVISNFQCKHINSNTDPKPHTSHTQIEKLEEFTTALTRKLSSYLVGKNCGCESMVKNSSLLVLTGSQTPFFQYMMSLLKVSHPLSHIPVLKNTENALKNFCGRC